MAKARPEPKPRSQYKDPLSHHHDEAPHAPPVSPWRVLAGLVLGTAVLAALNSESLTGYLEGIEPNAVTETLLPLAYRWNAMMEAAGVTQINQAIRDFIAWLHELRF